LKLVLIIVVEKNNIGFGPRKRWC